MITTCIRASIFSAILIALPAVSEAADWISYGEEISDEFRAFDMSRTRIVQGSIVRTWKRYRLINHKYAGYDFSITEWEINCAERRHKLISSFDYSSAGQIVNSDIWPDAEYRPIPPESIGDIETRVICGRLVKPSK